MYTSLSEVKRITVYAVSDINSNGFFNTSMSSYGTILALFEGELPAERLKNLTLIWRS
jgi:hypothetical protein